jgi:hypothetical protein
VTPILVAAVLLLHLSKVRLLLLLLLVVVLHGADVCHGCFTCFQSATAILLLDCWQQYLATTTGISCSSAEASLTYEHSEDS